MGRRMRLVAATSLLLSGVAAGWTAGADVAAAGRLPGPIVAVAGICPDTQHTPPPANPSSFSYVTVNGYITVVQGTFIDGRIVLSAPGSDTPILEAEVVKNIFSAIMPISSMTGYTLEVTEIADENGTTVEFIPAKFTFDVGPSEGPIDGCTPPDQLSEAELADMRQAVIDDKPPGFFDPLPLDPVEPVPEVEPPDEPDDDTLTPDPDIDALETDDEPIEDLIEDVIQGDDAEVDTEDLIDDLGLEGDLEVALPPIDNGTGSEGNGGDLILVVVGGGGLLLGSGYLYGRRNGYFGGDLGPLPFPEPAKWYTQTGDLPTFDPADESGAAVDQSWSGDDSLSGDRFDD